MDGSMGLCNTAPTCVPYGVTVELLPMYDEGIVYFIQFWSDITQKQLLFCVCIASAFLHTNCVCVSPGMIS